MIKQVSEKQQEWGMGSPLRLACQKALDKLNEYYNRVQSHAHSSIATICDLRFNFNVFNILMPNSTDNAKKVKIKSRFKAVFFKYQDWEVGIKAARILKEREDALETQLDEDEELLDVELYRAGPLELDTETEFTQYLKLPVML